MCVRDREARDTQGDRQVGHTQVCLKTFCATISPKTESDATYYVHSFPSLYPTQSSACIFEQKQ